MRRLFILMFVLIALAASASAECSHRYDAWRLYKEGTDYSQIVYLRKCAKCGKYDYKSEYPEGTLYKGMHDHAAEVSELKSKLSEMGYNVPANGYYDPQTFEAVKAFQKKYGLEQTGVAYPQTLRKIDEVLTMREVSVPNENGEYYLHKLGTMYYTVEGLNRFVINYAPFLKIPELNDCIDMYNAAFDSLKATHPEVNTYMYYVDSARTLDMGLSYDEENDRYVLPAEFSPVSQSYTILKDRLHVDAMSHLELTSSQQMFDYFYATDHHWNYKGSYEGYVGCVRLMLGEDEPVLIPLEEYVFPFVFNGSSSKNNSMSVSDELFTVYVFDRTPEYTSFINGKKRAYNSSKQYMSGKYVANTYTSHYGQYYGSDYAKIHFENPDAADRNLLMIGSSFSNPVKPLLTAHYKNIIYIDPRHYAEEYGKFSLKDMVELYDIDDVLVLCDITLLTNTANAVYP